MTHFARTTRTRPCATATRRVLTHSPGSKDLLRQQLDSAITACEQSRAQCAPHVQHHEHCRLHVTAAESAISTSTTLLAALS